MAAASSVFKFLPNSLSAPKKPKRTSCTFGTRVPAPTKITSDTSPMVIPEAVKIRKKSKKKVKKLKIRGKLEKREKNEKSRKIENWGKINYLEKIENLEKINYN